MHSHKRVGFDDCFRSPLADLGLVMADQIDHAADLMLADSWVFWWD
jgi:hypothetical protein